MVVTGPTRAPRPRFRTLDFAMELEESIVLPLVRRVRQASPKVTTIVDKRGLLSVFERTHGALAPAPRIVPRLQSLVDAQEVPPRRARGRASRFRAFVFAIIAALATAAALARLSGHLPL